MLGPSSSTPSLPCTSALLDQSTETASSHPVTKMTLQQASFLICKPRSLASSPAHLTGREGVISLREGHECDTGQSNRASVQVTYIFSFASQVAWRVITSVVGKQQLQETFRFQLAKRLQPTHCSQGLLLADFPYQFLNVYWGIYG